MVHGRRDRSRRVRRRAWRPVALALASLASGCADPGASVQQLGLPLTSFEWNVEGMTPRGPYLDASLSRESGVASRIFTLDTPECRSVLAPGGRIEHEQSGPAGIFARGDERCAGAGVSDLASRRQPRPIGRMSPSALATFTPIHFDEATIFLRGRFPLGETVGWPLDQDCVAVLPNTPACRAAAREGSATLQYWPSKESVLRLATAEPPGCPVLALLEPPRDGSAGGEGTPQAGRERRPRLGIDTRDEGPAGAASEGDRRLDGPGPGG